MSIERYVEQIPQSNDTVPAQLPIERGPANFLLFQVATALVTITLMEDGPREVFANVNGGVYIKRVKPWKNLRIDGPIGTQVTFWVGNENVDRDETDVRLQVTSIAGVTATVDTPAASIADKPTVPLPDGAQTAIFPANLTRRRISFSLLSNSVGWAANSVFARKAGGANNLFEVQPGQIYNDTLTAGMDIRNDCGAALTVMVYEVF
jgi:hypothetical protein